MEEPQSKLAFFASRKAQVITVLVLVFAVAVSMVFLSLRHLVVKREPRYAEDPGMASPSQGSQTPE
jgi:hypothetical protein